MIGYGCYGHCNVSIEKEPKPARPLPIDIVGVSNSLMEREIKMRHGDAFDKWVHNHNDRFGLLLLNGLVNDAILILRAQKNQNADVKQALAAADFEKPVSQVIIRTKKGEVMPALDYVASKMNDQGDAMAWQYKNLYSLMTGGSENTPCPALTQRVLGFIQNAL